MSGLWPLLLFAVLFLVLLAGYPVALTLAGVSLLFAGLGMMLGVFDASYLQFLPARMFGVMSNETLLAVPLFVFMGVTLEKARIAEQLLASMAALFGRARGGVVISVMLVGVLLAASTGIVGATVVTMGLISLPTMLRYGYDPKLASGSICAAGTLGQIIPPSIVLVLLGDVLSNAYQQAQLSQGIFAPESISVGDLFAGALLPGLLLVGLYLIYLIVVAWLQPERAPALPEQECRDGVRPKVLLAALLPPLLLIVAVLGSIIGGLATPTEAASVGAVGALLIALLRGMLSFKRLGEIAEQTLRITSMVFFILLAASLFALVFRGFGGEEWIHGTLAALPGGVTGAIIAVMLLMFLLGFLLDFIEITFIIVPIVGPVLLMMGVDPIWLGVMMAINLQTSFLTPPFGFALFYLRGVAPPEMPTSALYRGVLPFIVLQLLLLTILALFPGLATWLPEQVYGS